MYKASCITADDSSTLDLSFLNLTLTVWHQSFCSVGLQSFNVDF